MEECLGVGFHSSPSIGDDCGDNNDNHNHHHPNHHGDFTASSTFVTASKRDVDDFREVREVTDEIDDAKDVAQPEQQKQIQKRQKQQQQPKEDPTQRQTQSESQPRNIQNVPNVEYVENVNDTRDSLNSCGGGIGSKQQRFAERMRKKQHLERGTGGSGTSSKPNSKSTDRNVSNQRTSLYLTNLPTDGSTTERTLHSLFRSYGRLDRVTMYRRKDTGELKGMD